MGRIIIFLGNLFRSVQGWALIIFTILPAIWTVIAGYLDALNWSARTVFVMTVVLIGLGITFVFIRIWDYVFSYLESRKEQKRIADDLNRYLESQLGDYIDLPTAAAIWSGSREEGNYKRHLCFRALKGHTNSGRIRSPKNLAANGKANISTSVPLSELVRFFVERKIVIQSDIKTASA